MKKIILAGLFIVAVALTSLIFFKRKIGQTDHVRISDGDFKVEVVSTEEKRQLGLSGRKELCADCGMLFVFEKKGIYPFWMKDMRFDLDMIWILDGKVAYVAKNVSNEKGSGEAVNPGILADKVLEINAGLSEKFGIKEGDSVIFR